MTESTATGKEACPDCGSRDNLIRYSDGHGFCFGMGCGRYEPSTTADAPTRANASLKAGGYTALPKRKLTEETLRHFDYRINSPCQYATYYGVDGKPVAQKRRSRDKSFCWIGEPDKAVLFGQQLWKEGGKKVVVVEGEIDAMSLSQIQDHRWPVVSIRDGAGGAVKSVKGSLEWLSSFETVVFMFDNDEPGQMAAVAAAELLPPGKAFIARLPMKDPNEMLVKGRERDLIAAMWNAKAYRPDGIVSGSDLWDILQEPDPIREASYPYECLDNVLHGLRLAEVVTVVAGTGIGKSTLCREIAYDLIVNQQQKIGYVALEETCKKSALALMSIHVNQPLHLRPLDPEDPAFKEAYEATLGSDQCAFYDHFGSTDSDNLLAKIRYMVVGLGCKWIFLDHISIMVSGTESRDNERILLDKAMTRLASLAREVNCGIIIVCHLRKAPGNGKSFEEGAQISLADLRGTAGISQLSDAVVAAERNQQDHGEAGVTTLRVLKNRFAGVTGEAGRIQYSFETGRLREYDPFDEEKETDSGIPSSQFDDSSATF